MPKQVQLRRGTTVQHASFTGAIGEVTVDTTLKIAVVHDGSTVGGVPLAKNLDLAALTTRLGAFGVVTRLSDGVIPLNGLVKVGSDAAHVAVNPTTFGGSGNLAFGVALNATTGAGQSVTVAVLCLARESTVKMVADAAIAAGAFVEPSGITAGYVHTLTGTVGTHCVSGIALSASAIAGDLIDVAPCVFLRIV